MNNIIENKLKMYSPVTKDDYINALKEMIQEIALYSLSTTDFFDYAIFCGGTSLRIFYGLNRASEDLDFSLSEPNENFNLSKYFDVLRNVFSYYGFSFNIINNNNSDVIQSAFLKENTLNNLMVLELPNELKKYVDNNENIRIKFEVDTNPPIGGKSEYKVGLFPAPYRVRIFNKESLFSGKLHALIYRSWNERVKGRDYYDLIFYISNNIKPNMEMLKNSLIQTNTIDKNSTFDKKILCQLLLDKIESINFKLAKNDVIHFIKDSREIELWSYELFKDIIVNYFK